MLTRSFYYLGLLFALSLRTNAQSLISPGLGVSGTPSAADALKPTTSSPCGNMSIASNIDSANLVQADGNGDVTVQIQNFATGISGSRAVAAQIDSGGSGQSFVPAAVTTNGDQFPNNTANQSLVVQIPPGTLCTGGKDERRCLMSFITAGGFGNCVVITQPNGTAVGPTNPAPAIPFSSSAPNSTAIAKRDWRSSPKWLPAN